MTKRLGLQSKVDKYDPKVAQAAVAGDEKAQRRIARYNKGDVKITDKLHHRLTAVVKAPNPTLYHKDGEMRCGKPLCGSMSLERRGYAYTPQGTFQQYRCRECGGWTRDTKAIMRVHLAPVK